MFKVTVYLVHGLIFILATFVGLAGVYNISAPDPERTYEVWFTAIIIYDLLVILSTFVQLRLKSIWIFILSIIFLLGLFYFLPHVVLSIEDIMN